jgi:hypothetical protein
VVSTQLRKLSAEGGPLEIDDMDDSDELLYNNGKLRQLEGLREIGKVHVAGVSLG